MLVLLRRLKERVARRRQWWESLCLRCGLCCYQKEIRGGKVHVQMGAPCRFLDLSTRLCVVYERRFRVCRECRKMRWVHARFSRWLPDSCGYVRHYRRRRSRRPSRPATADAQ